jgi:hypothetical protein
MEELFGVLLISLFMEIIFWGLIYTTGRILTPIVSFGKWRADPLLINSETGKKEKKQSGVKLIIKSGEVYLGVVGVCLLGLCFWAILIMVLLLV